MKYLLPSKRGTLKEIDTDQIKKGQMLQTFTPFVEIKRQLHLAM